MVSCLRLCIKVLLVNYNIIYISLALICMFVQGKQTSVQSEYNLSLVLYPGEMYSTKNTSDH